MGKGLVLAVALVLLAAPAADALSEPSGELVAGGEETVLRLRDLPPGFQIGDDSGCGPLGPIEGGESRGGLEESYLRWLVRNWPEGCFYQYEQVFEVPGLEPAPPLVEAETLNTPSEGAAKAGFRLLAKLAKRSKEGKYRKTIFLPPTQARAFLFGSSNELVEGEIHQPATLLFWRSGKLLSFVEAAGMNPRRNDQAVLRLGQIQQERVEHPTPYTEAERDDTEVRLDNPRLKYPIYWVGRRFEPGRGFPASELEEAFAGTAVGPPGEKAFLWYEGFSLDAWTRHSWKRFEPTVLGRMNLRRSCVREHEVALEGGRAVVYAGYGRRRLRSCPERPPDDYWAVAHLGGMVIGINLTLCTGCLERGYGPYNSLAGMKTILRGLQVRPKPVFATP
jgi:hypothetical protein